MARLPIVASALVALLSSASALAAVYTSPLLTTFGQPGNYEVAPGGILDGVARLALGGVGCSGSLLRGGGHVLTAAHCVTNGNGDVTRSTGTASFEREVNNVAVVEDIPVVDAFVPAQWDGDILRGFDIAILELAYTAPADVERYELYTGDLVGLVGTKVGFGLSDTGNNGTTNNPLGFGTKRSGQNRYDALADLMLQAVGFIPGVDFDQGSVVQYDFDNGNTENDSFGFFFGIDYADLGLGADEVMAAPGDSGGPTFVTGPGGELLIAAVTSYGLRLVGSTLEDPDVNNFLDSSFGEFGGDTRVGAYAGFVESFLPAVPLPPTLPLLAAALVGLMAARRAAGRRRGST